MDTLNWGCPVTRFRGIGEGFFTVARRQQRTDASHREEESTTSTVEKHRRDPKIGLRDGPILAETFYSVLRNTGCE